jgi:hypothetical protein
MKARMRALSIKPSPPSGAAGFIHKTVTVATAGFIHKTVHNYVSSTPKIPTIESVCETRCSQTF